MAKNATRTIGAQQRAAVAASTEDSQTAALAATRVGESQIDDTAQRLKIRERISYGMGDVGGNLIFATAGTFLLFYFTDVVGIGAAIAGTLLLLGRMFDGTLDLIVGALIDKTHTRWGKARPWVLFATPVLVISFILLFNVPGALPESGKEIYAFVFYLLCMGIGFVSSNLAYHTLLSVITTSTKMRVSLTVIRTFFALITTMIVNFATIPFVTALGGGQGAWSTVVITYGLVAAATFMVLFFGTRERVRTPVPTEKKPAIRVTKKIGILFRNPYFFLVFLFFMITFVLQGSSGIGIYYAKDVIGNANAYSLIGLLGILPLIIGLWFMPPIVGRFGKRRTIFVGLAIQIIGGAIALIDPANYTILLISILIRGIGGVPISAVLFALVADVVDYGEWKSRVRLDGMTYSAATAGQNFGAGVGVALVGWLLAAGQYNAAAAHQTSSAISLEVFLMIWLPLIGSVLLGVIIYFLNIDKNLSQIQRDLAERRAAATAESTFVAAS